MKRHFDHYATCRACMVRYCWSGLPSPVGARCRRDHRTLTPVPRTKRTGYPDWYIKPLRAKP